MTKEALSILAEAKVAPDVAQKLIDFDARRQAQVAEAWAAQGEKWLGEAKADPHMGGERWDQTTAHIANARDHYPLAAKAIATLSTWGLMNHPDVARLFADLGRSFTEGRLPAGGAARPRVSRYPNTPGMRP